MYKQLEREPPTTKFHLMFDGVGDQNVPLFSHSEAYLAPGGMYVTVGAGPIFKPRALLNRLWLLWTIKMPRWLGGTNRVWKYVPFFLRNRLHELTLLYRQLPVMAVQQQKLENLAQYVSDGKLAIVHIHSQIRIDSLPGSVKPVIDSVFGFSEVLKAYERIMSQRAVGKVVVKVDPEVD